MKFSIVIVSLCLSISCAREDSSTSSKALFDQVNPAHSSIDFANELKESDEFNIIEYLYYYNGGGVAIGDINNDGLSDIYFSGNMVENRLYLNKGDFQFEDITEKAKVKGEGNWKTGVTMADVNADGLLDIYVCGVGHYKALAGYNQLFINNGDLTFTERSKEFGLDFQGFSTQVAFFDYDLDGDLDMYLLNHSVHSQRSQGKIGLRNQIDSLAGDRLYQNQLAQTKISFFKNVTSESGILSSSLGYGLGIGISDINRDGYPDIYVSNDFQENDYLYINQKNGTFKHQERNMLAHTSRFSMGNDIADINNDGWPDVITLDMMPHSETVIKTSAGEDSYEVYKYKLSLGYLKQTSRNTLQINWGNIDNEGLLFSDVAPAVGIEATDWSWAPLLVDFDGDGLKDIFISNGIVKRPNDLDYINFISSDSVQKAYDLLPWLAKMPEGKVSNFIFKNEGDLSFSDKTVEWGISLPSFSNGAAYGDLDNDGDPDLVVNRINESALIYRNNSEKDKFIKIKLIGEKNNIFAMGAKVTVSQDSSVQMQEVYPTRGFSSSSDYPLIFGLHDSSKPAVIRVTWPNGKTSSRNVNGTGQIEMKYGADPFDSSVSESSLVNRLLSPSDTIPFKHQDDNFNPFNRESLIPYMLSTEGPPLTVGDINGDGIEDAFVGGAKGQAGALFIQTVNGSFNKLTVPDLERDSDAEDIAASFFDADKDGDNDLIVVSGGQEEVKSSDLLAPRLYLNDGKGHFKRAMKSIPEIYLQASCVKPADFDNDGDIDLFIGSNVIPMLYGMSPQSYLLVNDGKGIFSVDPFWLGSSKFDNPTRVKPGMIKDAVWADMNNDKLLDLILVGDWMPITILIQERSHRFSNRTIEYQLRQTRGWWNSIIAHDFDGDGDLDLVAGNLGTNSRLEANADKPLKMYVGDFDSNGGSDHILVYYNGEKNYPFPSRDVLVKQLPHLKKKFLNYKDYRDVRFEDIVVPQQQGNSAEFSVDGFSSVYLQNDGQSFTVKSLPNEAQLFPVYSMIADDIDQDGNIDLMLVGNLNATQPEIGPFDAGLGLVLKGDGKGNFSSLTPSQSGFVVKGEAREIVSLRNALGKKIYLVSRNNDTVLSFKK